MSAEGYGSQSKPIPTDEPSAHDLVIEDVKQRKESGLKKYGTTLQASNGRDHLQDAYEEALDLCVYLRIELERRNNVRAAVRSAFNRKSNLKEDGK